MSGEARRPLAEIAAPYGRHVRLDEVAFESGMRLMRVTIREGRRITVLDIDAPTARRWAETMAAWAGTQPGPADDGEAGA